MLSPGGGTRLYSVTLSAILKDMFNSHDNFSAEWCFNTRSSEEGKTYNDKDDEFRCKQNDNQLYNLLNKAILLF